MDKYVCRDCVEEESLRKFINKCAVEIKCSYCGKESDKDIAVGIKYLCEHIENCIREEYDEAANVLSYESAEGGYIGDYWTTYELLFEEHEVCLPNDNNFKLSTDLLTLLPETHWCKPDPFAYDEKELLVLSWDQFCNITKHKLRFFFSSYSSHPKSEFLTPLKMLNIINEYCEKEYLFKTLKKGTIVYRARYQKSNEYLITGHDLGPPPVESAIQSNRMSPPGIVMFYTSDNYQTALKEVSNRSATYVVGGFELLKDLRILDITELEEIPGFFDEISDMIEYNVRQVLFFLHHVRGEISKPIERDDKVHIEYVPTQIFTEYFRTKTKNKINGIKYSSSVDPGNISYVLFATRENVINNEPHNSNIIKINKQEWFKLISRDEYQGDFSP